MRVILSAIAFAFVLTGCISTGFTKTTNLTLTPKDKNCELDLVIDGKPEKPYEVIGRVTTDGTAPGLFAIGENEEKAIQRLKEEACKAGADVMFSINTGSNGEWTSKGYSKSVRGSATVAIYKNMSH